MKHLLFILVSVFYISVQAQGTRSAADERRTATREEVRVLAHLADSFFTELKFLYRKEIKENSPQKYQPERIALVRSYLLLFQHMQTSCEIVSYDKKDILAIFGKPDTVIYKGNPGQEMQWLYGNLQRQYVRINNLRYRFYYVNNKLQGVRRDDR
jgi:hypothetical protein